ncbi:MAG: ribosome biogenesis GTPase Der [Flavobacteriales bacterium]|nr:ribosome biogenesis GTPase Der [Flavobacteriales bacterium]
MSNIVAIVGRPNVGKSTLFNRLVGARKAIVKEVSGVTRDRHYGQSEWNGKEFSVIDTGGYVTGSDDIFEGEIRRQVEIAIEEANVVLFMVDVETGVTDLDQAVASVLRKSVKPVIVVANKVDNNERHNDVYEFYNFGLEEVFGISSINGAGTGDLLDLMVSKFTDDEAIEDLGLPRIAVVGKPNVGKSSLTNALLGEERNIVTDISGTTRDSIDTRYTAFGFDMVLVDTAGIRKKSKVHEDIEFYSVMRSIRTIEDCDVCLFMIDGTEPLQNQDMSIFSVIEKNKKGIVLLVNKWDLIDKDTSSTKKYEEVIKERLAPFTDLPIVFISALNKQRIHKALETAMEVFENRTQKIPTSKLNEIMQEAIQKNPPPSYKGKYIKIKYVTQLPTHSPSFAFFCNLPQYIKDPYKRYVENQLREHFNLHGVPIRIFFRKK